MSAAEGAELPLLRRFPALRALPRAPLGVFPSPVARLEVPGAAHTLQIPLSRSIWKDASRPSIAPVE